MKLSQKQTERWSPWVLLLAVLLVWQFICVAFDVPEYLFPSPSRSSWSSATRSCGTPGAPSG